MAVKNKMPQGKSKKILFRVAVGLSIPAMAGGGVALGILLDKTPIIDPALSNQKQKTDTVIAYEKAKLKIEMKRIEDKPITVIVKGAKVNTELKAKLDKTIKNASVAIESAKSKNDLKTVRETWTKKMNKAKEALDAYNKAENKLAQANLAANKAHAIKMVKTINIVPNPNFSAKFRHFQSLGLFKNDIHRDNLNKAIKTAITNGERDIQAANISTFFDVKRLSIETVVKAVEELDNYNATEINAIIAKARHIVAISHDVDDLLSISLNPEIKLSSELLADNEVESESIHNSIRKVFAYAKMEISTAAPSAIPGIKRDAINLILLGVSKLSSDNDLRNVARLAHDDFDAAKRSVLAAISKIDLDPSTPLIAGTGNTELQRNVIEFVKQIKKAVATSTRDTLPMIKINGIKIIKTAVEALSKDNNERNIASSAGGSNSLISEISSAIVALQDYVTKTLIPVNNGLTLNSTLKDELNVKLSAAKKLAAAATTSGELHTIKDEQLKQIKVIIDKLNVDTLAQNKLDDVKKAKSSAKTEFSRMRTDNVITLKYAGTPDQSLVTALNDVITRAESAIDSNSLTTKSSVEAVKVAQIILINSAINNLNASNEATNLIGLKSDLIQKLHEASTDGIFQLSNSIPDTGNVLRQNLTDIVTKGETDINGAQDAFAVEKINTSVLKKITVALQKLNDNILEKNTLGLLISNAKANLALAASASKLTKLLPGVVIAGTFQTAIDDALKTGNDSFDGVTLPADISTNESTAVGLINTAVETYNAEVTKLNLVKAVADAKLRLSTISITPATTINDALTEDTTLKQNILDAVANAATAFASATDLDDVKNIEQTQSDLITKAVENLSKSNETLNNAEANKIRAAVGVSKTHLAAATSVSNLTKLLHGAVISNMFKTAIDAALKTGNDSLDKVTLLDDVSSTESTALGLINTAINTYNTEATKVNFAQAIIDSKHRLNGVSLIPAIAISDTLHEDGTLKQKVRSAFNDAKTAVEAALDLADLATIEKAQEGLIIAAVDALSKSNKALNDAKSNGTIPVPSGSGVQSAGTNAGSTNIDLPHAIINSKLRLGEISIIPTIVINAALVEDNTLKQKVLSVVSDAKTAVESASDLANLLDIEDAQKALIVAAVDALSRSNETLNNAEADKIRAAVGVSKTHLATAASVLNLSKTLPNVTAIGPSFQTAIDTALKAGNDSLDDVTLLGDVSSTETTATGLVNAAVGAYNAEIARLNLRNEITNSKLRLGEISIIPTIVINAALVEDNTLKQKVLSVVSDAKTAVESASDSANLSDIEDAQKALIVAAVDALSRSNETLNNAYAVKVRVAVGNFKTNLALAASKLTKLLPGVVIAGTFKTAVDDALKAGNDSLDGVALLTNVSPTGLIVIGPINDAVKAYNDEATKANLAKAVDDAKLRLNAVSVVPSTTINTGLTEDTTLKQNINDAIANAIKAVEAALDLDHVATIEVAQKKLIVTAVRDLSQNNKIMNAPAAGRARIAADISKTNLAAAASALNLAKLLPNAKAIDPSFKSKIALALRDGNLALDKVTLLADVSTVEASAIKTISAAVKAYNARITRSNLALVVLRTQHELSTMSTTPIIAINEVLHSNSTAVRNVLDTVASSITKISAAPDLAHLLEIEKAQKALIVAAVDALSRSNETLNNAEADKIRAAIGNSKTNLATAASALNLVKLTHGALAIGPSFQTAIDEALKAGNASLDDVTLLDDVSSTEATAMGIINTAVEAYNVAIKLANLPHAIINSKHRLNEISLIPDTAINDTLNESTTLKQKIHDAVTNAIAAVEAASDLAHLAIIEDAQSALIIKAVNDLSKNNEIMNVPVADRLRTAVGISKTNLIASIELTKLLPGAVIADTFQTAVDEALKAGNDSLDDVTLLTDVSSTESTASGPIAAAVDAYNAEAIKVNLVQAIIDSKHRLNGMSLAPATAISGTLTEDATLKQKIHDAVANATTAVEAASDLANLSDIEDAQKALIVAAVDALSKNNELLSSPETVEVRTAVEHSKSNLVIAASVLNFLKLNTGASPIDPSFKTAIDAALKAGNASLDDVTLLADVSDIESSVTAPITAAVDAYNAEITKANLALAVFHSQHRLSTMSVTPDVAIDKTLDSDSIAVRNVMDTVAMSISKVGKAPDLAHLITIEEEQKNLIIGSVRDLSRKNEVMNAPVVDRLRIAVGNSKTKLAAAATLNFVKLNTGASAIDLSFKTAIDAALKAGNDSLDGVTTLSDVLPAELTAAGLIKAAVDAYNARITELNLAKAVADAKLRIGAILTTPSTIINSKLTEDNALKIKIANAITDGKDALDAVPDLAHLPEIEDARKRLIVEAVAALSDSNKALNGAEAGKVQLAVGISKANLASAASILNSVKLTPGALLNDKFLAAIASALKTGNDDLDKVLIIADVHPSEIGSVASIQMAVKIYNDEVVKANLAFAIYTAQHNISMMSIRPVIGINKALTPDETLAQNIVNARKDAIDQIGAAHDLSHVGNIEYTQKGLITTAVEALSRNNILVNKVEAAKLSADIAGAKKRILFASKLNTAKLLPSLELSTEYQIAINSALDKGNNILNEVTFSGDASAAEATAIGLVNDAVKASNDKVKDLNRKLIWHNRHTPPVLKWVADYISHPEWVDNIDWGIMHIKANTFMNFVFPKDFYLPEGIKIIDENSFKGSTFPSAFRMPFSVVKTERVAFAGAHFGGAVYLPTVTETVHGSSFANITYPSTSAWHTLPPTERYHFIISDDKTFFDEMLIEPIKRIIAASKMNTAKLLPGAVFASSFQAAIDAALKAGKNILGAVSPDKHGFFKRFNAAEARAIAPIKAAVKAYNDEVAHANAISANFRTKVVQDWYSHFSDKHSDWPANFNWVTMSVKPNTFQNEVLPEDFYLPGGIVNIGVNAFKGATFSGDFSIAASVATLGDNSFHGAKFLKGLKVLKTTTYTKGSAFSASIKQPDFDWYYVNPAYKLLLQSIKVFNDNVRMISDGHLSAASKLNTTQLRFGAELDPSFQEAIDDALSTGRDALGKASTAALIHSAETTAMGKINAVVAKYNEGVLAANAAHFAKRVADAKTTITPQGLGELRYGASPIEPSFQKAIDDVLHARKTALDALVLDQYPEAAVIEADTVKQMIPLIAKYNDAIGKSNTDRFNSLVNELQGWIIYAIKLGHQDWVNSVDWVTMHVKQNTFQDETFSEDFYIPKGITGIDEHAFKGSTFNGVLRLPSSIIELKEKAFENIELKQTLFVPLNAVDADGSAFFKAKFPPENSRHILPTGPYRLTIESSEDFYQGGLADSKARLAAASKLNLVKLLPDVNIDGKFQRDITEALQIGVDLIDKSDVYSVIPIAEKTALKLITSAVATFNETATKANADAAADAANKLSDSSKKWHADFINHPDWHNNINWVTMSVKPNAFQNEVFPEDFYLPEGIINIGANAFKGATFSGDFSLAASVATLENGSFNGAIFMKGLKVLKTTTYTKGTALAMCTHSAGYDWYYDNPAYKLLIENMDGLRTIAYGHLSAASKLNTTQLTFGAELDPSFQKAIDDALSAGRGKIKRAATATLIHSSEPTVMGEINAVVAKYNEGVLAANAAHFAKRVAEAKTTITPPDLEKLHYGAPAIDPSFQTAIDTALQAGRDALDALALAQYPEVAVTEANIVKQITPLIEKYNEAINQSNVDYYNNLPSEVQSWIANAVEHNLPDWIDNIDWVTMHVKANAFQDETFPDDFYIPDGITGIDEHAFKGSTFNGILHLPSSIIELKEKAFENIELKQTLFVPLNAVDADGSAFSMVKFLPEYSQHITHIGPYRLTIESHDDFILHSLAEAKARLTVASKLNTTKLLPGVTIYDLFQNAIDKALQTGMDTVGKSVVYSAIQLAETVAMRPISAAVNAYNDMVTKANLDATADAANNLSDSSKKWQADFINHPEWHNNINWITMSVKPNTFQNEVLPEDFYLPDGITNIGVNAFKGATFSGDFSLAVSVATLGNDSFHGAIFMKGLKVLKTTAYLRGSAFAMSTHSSGYDWYFVNPTYKLLLLNMDEVRTTSNGLLDAASKLNTTQLTANVNLDPSFQKAIDDALSTGKDAVNNASTANSIYSAKSTAMEKINTAVANYNTGVLAANAAHFAKRVADAKTTITPPDLEKLHYGAPAIDSSFQAAIDTALQDGKDALDALTQYPEVAVTEANIVKQIAPLIVKYNDAINQSNVDYYNNLPSEVQSWIANAVEHNHPDWIDNINWVTMHVKANAFQDETFPDDFYIPEGITGIDEHAFKGSTFNGILRLPSSIIELKEKAFENIELKQTLFVPLNAVDADGSTFSMVKFLPEYSQHITHIGIYRLSIESHDDFMLHSLAEAKARLTAASKLITTQLTLVTTIDPSFQSAIDKALQTGMDTIDKSVIYSVISTAEEVAMRPIVAAVNAYNVENRLCAIKAAKARLLNFLHTPRHQLVPGASAINSHFEQDMNTVFNATVRALNNAKLDTDVPAVELAEHGNIANVIKAYNDEIDRLNAAA